MPATSPFQIVNSSLTRLRDHLGESHPNIQMVMRDDCWRPLLPKEVNPDQRGFFDWQGVWGQPEPYGHGDDAWTRPMDLDVWGDPGCLTPYATMDYAGRLKIQAAKFDGIEGFKLTIDLEDRRPANHPVRRVLKIPVGFRFPYASAPSVFGLQEGYLDPKILNGRIDQPGFVNQWFYLEAELFGLQGRQPLDGHGQRKDQWNNRLHCGSPTAIFSHDDETWWSIGGEVDYGAAISWENDHLLVYTTLYLKPGGKAHWHACLHRQKTDHPANVYLSSTRPGGFYDQMNPPMLQRKGPPEGPIAFININRPRARMKELQRIGPKMVILNYVFPHVSYVADMYDEWTTYEGYHFTEAKLKALIAEIKAMGAKVGFYGTQVEQPENHSPVHDADFVLDAWGRRFNAWEPGNWVVDAGSGLCADRLAKAEAEFAKYYGLECVFVDRLDHLSVNANPARQRHPADQRLELIPSVRLGIIELNKRRVKWMRKLNPSLYIGLNNTTQWAGGVRYADYNNLEGGMDLEPPIFFLNAPFGVVHKQHYNTLLCDFDQDIVDHGIVQADHQHMRFDPKRHQLYRDALTDGVLPQPYEDELFVDPESEFFKGWNDKRLPDEEKLRRLDTLKFYGGDSWRSDEDAVGPAMETARRTCFPVRRIWDRPEQGVFPDAIRFSAREGEPGGLFVGAQNLGTRTLEVDWTIGGHGIQGEIPPNTCRVWYTPDHATQPLQTGLF